VTLDDFIQRRNIRTQNEPSVRTLCVSCLQPVFSCYCRHIKKFDSKINFVILIHPLEWRRRIATGRMSHLCLENSRLIQGYSYSESKPVNKILSDPLNYSVVLYPGSGSINISSIDCEAKNHLFPSDKKQAKKLVVFVIDGTWSTASKMVRRSDNLMALPQICFTPPKASNFRVRKQPKANCYSTIEAIHEVIELLGESQGFDIKSRKHDGLIHVFDQMVEKQLLCQRQFNSSRHLRNYQSVGK